MVSLRVHTILQIEGTSRGEVCESSVSDYNLKGQF
jgi:hypothetical protein